MYLKRLTITKDNGDVIRHIKFFKGLNLIVGISNKDGTSNSLGKTTLVRCLNYCFGGKIEEFYTDNENKKIENTVVKDFLISNLLKFELTLGNNLETDSISDIKISRQIAINSKTSKIDSINSINGETYSLESFHEVLKQKLFSLKEPKPTFRQLIPKFVRNKDYEVSNILKYLHASTSIIDYTTIWLFLFGFENIEKINSKLSLANDFKKVSENYKALKSIVPNGLQQKIDLLEVELSEKIELRDSFQIERRYAQDEDELAVLQSKIHSIEESITKLTLDKDVLVERLNTLINDEFKYDAKNVKYIYEEANLLNIDVQRKFEDTINFHNGMLKNEESYLLKRIAKIDEKLNTLFSIRLTSIESYNSVLSKLGQQGSLAEYTKLNESITKLSSEISNDKALLGQLAALAQDKIAINTQLDSLIFSLKESISVFTKNNINIFNTYFSNYSESIYKEKWYVTFDEDSYRFDIKAFESNAGSGKKQTLVAAFDIAYMSFIQDKNINLPYPRFTTQDKIEIIDIKELYKLADLVLNSNGQLIAPIIQDKFDNLDESFTGSVILELSSSNRFFGI
ncbi:MULTISPECIES: DUF2326 domain-containing protein [unclassified Gilliamella]|uniref:DUF2326 domain-containing protein n=1 Tax=unclassified Gilliamella TaxID=2685620 RepID=UPI00226A93C3|nr:MULTISPECIES: DUF2326 domain-containing protein [unclassified Gilliamella]MCX8581874.1 DUF2326 domain-containing protein [Gilliamella sp. B3482]MCX8662311.1 DUF2326 domain-containing protein [Gilliamella sp. B2911]